MFMSTRQSLPWRFPNWNFASTSHLWSVSSCPRNVSHFLYPTVYSVFTRSRYRFLSCTTSVQPTSHSHLTPIHFNIILPLNPSLPSGLSLQAPTQIFSLLCFHACHMPHLSNNPLFGHLTNRRWRIWTNKLLYIQFSPFCCYFLSPSSMRSQRLVIKQAESVPLEKETNFKTFINKQVKKTQQWDKALHKPLCVTKSGVWHIESFMVVLNISHRIMLSEIYRR